ncbi:MAG: hypothetical protein ACD_74C00084G0002, partial [uncultured bacterium]
MRFLLEVFQKSADCCLSAAASPPSQAATLSKS